MSRGFADFLAGIYPLSGLPGKDLQEAGSRSGQKEVSPGEIIPLDHKDHDSVYLIKDGVMQILSHNEVVDTLVSGEFFGYESFYFLPPLGQSAVAAQDSTLCVISGDDVRHLLEHHQVNLFFQRKAEIFRSRIQDIQHWRSASRMDPYMCLTLRDVAVKDPVTVQRNTPVSLAAGIMLQEGSAACLVRQEGRFLGIVTEQDILKKVVARDLDPKAVTAGEIMSAPLITAKSHELLFQAFSRMVSRGVRRLVLQDNGADPRGIIEDRDLLSVKGENPVYLSREISRAGDLTELKSVFQQVRNMVLRSAAEGVGVFQLGRLISDMHHQIQVRVHELLLAEMNEPAPFAFCILALGSEGRREQYLATDQDNALIYSEASGKAQMSYLEEFSAKFIQALLDLGFPPCPHEVMLNNPQWRMSIDQALDLVDDMAQTADKKSVVVTSLLLDMRHVTGDGQLAGMLKSYLFKRIRRSSLMLKYMANEAVRFKPPLGFFNKLVVEKSGRHKGRLDVKKGGIFPLTHGIRTLAVEHSILETSTEERISRLHEQGVFSTGFSAGLRQSLEFLQTLRVRTQAQQIKSQAEPDNFISPDRLSVMERDRLKDCFKMVMEFQSVLSNKYNLRLLT
ncbi:putative nucleotidyltransferase substrate binding domain-containing protein [Desulfonatronospira sp.]|uniref:putative nucleotidyltransferase substrate binding domain-containing protein n=1 Tax=Desulfonatronospira sp. TaxID=1962951 RepID=UPI0025BD8299|nr:putative nucleotidyltransferase substrate binding domain-containing protein [Desulfonatronospira sp.]